MRPGPRPARVPAAGTPPRASLGARRGAPRFLHQRPGRSRASPAAHRQLGRGLLAVLAPPRSTSSFPGARQLTARCGWAQPGSWNLSPGVAPAPVSTCATRAAPREAARAPGARRRADCALPGLVSARRRGCARAPAAPRPAPAARTPSPLPRSRSGPQPRSPARALRAPLPHLLTAFDPIPGRARPGPHSPTPLLSPTRVPRRAQSESSLLPWCGLAAAAATRLSHGSCTPGD